MIQGLIFLVVFFCNTLFAAPICDHKLDQSALSFLAQKLGISPEENLVSATQMRWLRKPGQERWEMAEITPEKRHFVLDWSKEHGLFDPWMPTLPFYDQALILGATTGVMKSRLAFLAELWEEGTRFDKVVWLTGDRPLDPRVDSLAERAETESEVAHILWEEAELPEKMRSLPVEFIASPMKEDGKRPNTADTIFAWIRVFSEPCTALFIFPIQTLHKKRRREI